MVRDEEDLVRSSNGWGLITVPGGNISTAGVPVFVRAQFLQQGLASLGLPVIHSEYRSHNLEVNDTVRMAELSRSISGCWPATTRSTARGCARTARRR